MNGRNGIFITGIAHRKKRALAALAVGLLATLIVVGGCTTHQVRTPDSDPLQQTYQSKSTQAYLWGLVLSPQVVSGKCADGLNDVVVKRSFLHDLASVLTFGIWMPSEVEFRCRAPRGDGGSFPTAPRRP